MDYIGVNSSRFALVSYVNVYVWVSLTAGIVQTSKKCAVNLPQSPIDIFKGRFKPRSLVIAGRNRAGIG
jgi:hypothetical protein